MAPTFEPLQERHLRDVAGLLAARHRRDREREPALLAAFEVADATLPHVERVFRQPGAAGSIAVRDGSVVGFALAQAMLPRPEHFLARFFPPRAMVVPYHGHALAGGEDASLYRPLYAHLSEAWVARGFFEHFINVPTGDAAASEAWHSLGFGRDVACALRDVAAPVDGAASVDIHPAGREDIEVIAALDRALMVHHALAPIFAPVLPETDASGRELTLGLLDDPKNAHWVAYRNGEALGMNTFMPPTFLSPLLAPESSVYLLQGIVERHARGGGVGRALLAHSMAWARDEGYRWCTLHFAWPNVSGAAFWQGNGFRPIEHRLRRRVDERIAWAGARGDGS